MTVASVSAWRTLAKPLRVQRAPRGLDAAWAWTIGQLPRLRPLRAALWRQSGEIVSLQATIAARDDSWLREETLRLRMLVRRGRCRPSERSRALAVISEAARRVMGFCPHREQLMGALALDRGCIAEMATGEGKTLTAALASTIAGWRGRGAHVITVNDYLAQRDAQWMRPVFEFCSVSVGVIRQESSERERREAYAADVTYGTNKEIAADFLRDRLRIGSRPPVGALGSDLIARIAGSDAAPTSGDSAPIQRGLACAVVDEADSVLIDEAVTPLIIAGPGRQRETEGVYERAARVADEMIPERDYTSDRARREIRLTLAGKQRASEALAAERLAWGGARRREELVSQALAAREHYIQGVHYVINENRVVIVDEFTGRLMADRTWRDGMQQAIEAKEGLGIRPELGTLASISFQRFFRLYGHMSGMTGTAREASGELWRTYRLAVVQVPTHRPVARKQPRDRVFARAREKWNAIEEESRQLCASGRAVLIGTRSVQASEHLSAALASAGQAHAVLSAVRHAEEAPIIARAGLAASVTVATNMAGRGTDIRLGEGVAAAGGLAVIASERHESRRVDRQLFGRSGRQGDPGSAQAIVSLEDELIQRYTPRAGAVLRRISPTEVSSGLTGFLARIIFRLAERRASASARRMRSSVLRSDDWLDDSLGFAGGSL